MLGIRTVAYLTPSQLARKRCSDREYQRVRRARTKTRIEFLQHELESLRNTQDTTKRVRLLVWRNKILEDEIIRLRHAEVKVIDQPLSGANNSICMNNTSPQYSCSYYTDGNGSSVYCPTSLGLCRFNPNLNEEQLCWGFFDATVCQDATFINQTTSLLPHSYFPIERGLNGFVGNSNEGTASIESANGRFANMQPLTHVDYQSTNRRSNTADILCPWMTP